MFVGYLLLTPFPSATQNFCDWLLNKSLYTSPSIVRILFFFFLIQDCTSRQVDGTGTRQPLQASLCPYPIALLKKRDRVESKQVVDEVLAG